MRTAAAVENPHEALARERKASAITLYLWNGLTEEERRDAKTPWFLSHGAQPLRIDFARGAGQKEPSQTTWDLVVQKICSLVQAQRASQPDSCVTCTGAGSIEVPTCHHSSNCPCAGEDAPCDRCSGSGHEPCESCGDPKHPGTEVTAFGLFCPDCTAQLTAESRRPRLQVMR